MCRIIINFYYVFFYENYRGKCKIVFIYILVEIIRLLNNFFLLNRFVVVVVGLDNLFRLIFEKLLKKEIYG